MNRVLPAIVAVLALLAIVLATERLMAANEGVSAQDIEIGATPATVFRPQAPRRDAVQRPAVLIAHGFAGSRTLMAPFGVALARHGYTAVTFDFVGHGEHPRPMTGDVNSVDGPTRTMVRQLRQVEAFVSARIGASGYAVLGHSMASDIIVRYAADAPAMRATIAVSMFSPAVTATVPRNLLVIVGNWEGMLKREALRAVGLATSPEPAEAGTTYGSFADGTARRAVFADRSEHIAVLFSPQSLTAAVEWLDRTFSIDRTTPIEVSLRLPWIGLLVLGIVALSYPLARLLPVLAQPAAGAGLGWRTLWPVIVLPAVVVPLLLQVLPSDFLPIVVADYLAVHFLAYGVLTLALAAWARRRAGPRAVPSAFAASLPLLAAVTLLVTAYVAGALGVAIETTFTNYHPVPARYPLFAAMLAGTLVYFLASEWAVRGEGAGPLAPTAEKLGFVLSLAIAVALDFERLFFLIIIVPVIVIFFVIYGLLSRWSYRSTGHPLPGAVASAVAFAWGISVTFPMMAG
ncbi:MAG: alpha/beta fold hydrolase [Pseudomonadota bacterium]